MKGRWKIHGHLFRGANTYEFKLKTDEGEKIIPLIVDEDGFFQLSESAPAGFYAFARIADNQT